MEFFSISIRFMCLFILVIHCATTQETKTIKIRMPGVQPEKDDDYLCTAVKLDPEEMYVTKFTVEGTAERAHHMILMGCPEIRTSEASWNCGNHGACTGGSNILFAWAKNAPGASMPRDVGFRISGSRSKVKYLVLQVHYAHKLKPEEKDYSGMDLELTSQPQRYIAGIFLLMAMPTIPPFQPKVHADSHCPVDLPVPAKIFAFRVHAHSLGTVITGYKYSRKTDKVVEIARGNPQWPQAFYSTKEQFDLEKDDTLLVRCTYDSSERNRTTETGATANDEMCNLYLMYYTDAEKGSPYQACGYLPGEKELKLFPEDSDVPLPPNPILEAYALHGKKQKPGDQAATHAQQPHVIDHQEATVTALSPDPMDLNRIYYKQIFDHAAHHQHPDGGVQGQPIITQPEKATSRSDDGNEDFHAFLQFYRQFFNH